MYGMYPNPLAPLAALRHYGMTSSKPVNLLKPLWTMCIVATGNLSLVTEIVN